MHLTTLQNIMYRAMDNGTWKALRDLEADPQMRALKARLAMAKTEAATNFFRAKVQAEKRSAMAKAQVEKRCAMAEAKANRDYYKQKTVTFEALVPLRPRNALTNALCDCMR